MYQSNGNHVICYWWVSCYKNSSFDYQEIITWKSRLFWKGNIYVHYRVTIWLLWPVTLRLGYFWSKMSSRLTHVRPFVRSKMFVWKMILNGRNRKNIMFPDIRKFLPYWPWLDTILLPFFLEVSKWRSSTSDWLKIIDSFSQNFDCSLLVCFFAPFSLFAFLLFCFFFAFCFLLFCFPACFLAFLLAFLMVRVFLVFLIY